MLRKLALIVVVALIPAASIHSQRPLNPGISSTFETCNAYGELGVAFVGRLGEPVTFHMSGEPEIEKARQHYVRTQAEVARLRASLDEKARLEREREFAIAVIRAQDELNRRRAMYPPPYDLTLYPVTVEQAFRGVTDAILMVHRANPTLRIEPGELYLIAGMRSKNYLFPFPEMAHLVPVEEYVDVMRATPIAAAQQEVRFFASTTSGATVLGTLQDRSGAPLAGVRIEVTSGTGAREATTKEDGSFAVSGLGTGLVTIKPVLHDDLGVINTSALTFQIVERGCKTVRLTAALNGRLSGRIISATGKSLAGVQVVLQQVDLQRQDPPGIEFSHGPRLARTSVRPNEDGTFQFSGQIPGSYLLSAHLEVRVNDGKVRQVTTFYPGTPDAALAAPITIGRATQHDGFDFLVLTE